MILWLLAIVLVVIAYVLYTMILNREFLRCPHCGKVGSWRFNNVEEPVEEYDEDECLVGSTVRQRCRKCGGQVFHVWSDFEGREIRPTAEARNE